jgi:hypothetical protein
MPSTTLEPFGTNRSSADVPDDSRAEWRPLTWRFVPGVKRVLRSKLDELGALPINWDGFGAPRIDPAIIDAAREFVDRMSEHFASGLTIVPMSSGNLQLEWHDGPKVLELEFETPKAIHYLKWDPPHGIEEEDSFSAADFDKALQLIHWFTKSL